MVLSPPLFLEDRTLLLVDASSYLYRAYHAMPNLRGPEDAPTGALYGIINMLRRLSREIPAKYSACVFDAKGKKHREQWYADYKAHRRPMPDDLVQQIEPIHHAVRALGWPLLIVDKVEADDVMGTLAKEAERTGMKVVISTGDKDLAQLVTDSITLVNTMSNETLDRVGVIEKFGVPPERIIDYLTLVGDTVDNIPGVAKCGPKTALQWLAKYGTLAEIIAHADEIHGVVGNNLRQSLDFLPTARKLLTIDTHCELTTDVESIKTSLKMRAPDPKALRDLYLRYGFKRWLAEAEVQATETLTHSASEDSENTVSGLCDYQILLTWEQFDAWLAKMQVAELTAFDTETTSLNPFAATLVGLSFAIAPGCAAYLPLAHRSPDAPLQLPFDDALMRIKPWLSDPHRKKVGQHLKYDEQVLANYGIVLAGIAHDTLLESYVLESHHRHDLYHLALRHLGIKTIRYEEVCGKGAAQICFDQAPFSEAAAYATKDADIALRLHQALYPQLKQQPGLAHIYHEIEMPVCRVLSVMERNGVLIDTALLDKQSQELTERLIALEAQAYQLAGGPFNLNSPKQIGEIFFDRLKLPVLKKTPGGTPSTNEEVLQKLAEDYPLPKVLLDYRALAKLKSTYTDKLPNMVNPKTGRVHTNYAQAVAVTGRLASNEPNLQNIPVRTVEGRRIREAFIAPPGWKIISADYSQIELRIIAHLSGDENLLSAFATGEDIHRTTAAEIFAVPPVNVSSEQRRVAKMINFGLIYGMSAFGLAARLNIARDAARLYIDRYFDRHPAVARYMDDTRERAKRDGYVETVFGRRLWLPEINGGSGPRRAAAERAAINAPMQGTAADLIKRSMIAVQTWLTSAKITSVATLKTTLKAKMIMQVHDELVLEAPEAECDSVVAHLPQLMSAVAQLNVPLIVEVGIGGNWEEAH